MNTHERRLRDEPLGVLWLVVWALQVLSLSFTVALSIRIQEGLRLHQYVVAVVGVGVNIAVSHGKWRRPI